MPPWQQAAHNRALCIDLPSLNRWCYGAVLLLTRQTDVSYVAHDYDAKWRENRRRGAGLPADTLLTMRAVNLLAGLMGFAALYTVAYQALGRPLVALLPLAPLLIMPTFPLEVIPRLGPGPFLFATLSIFLAFWTAAHVRGLDRQWPWTLYLGLLGGLCALAKQNGALALFAYGGYLLVHIHRPRDIFAPLLAGAAAAFVFYVGNPGLLAGSLTDVPVDIIKRRMEIIERSNRRHGTFGFLEICQQAIACWPAIPAFLAAAWKCRKCHWAEPVLWWGALLFFPTLLMINATVPRYVAPARMALLFTGGLSISALAFVSGPVPSLE